MSFRRAYAIVLRQVYLLRGSPARILPLFAWVAIDVVLWGFITRYLNSVSGAGVNFVPILLGAVLFWDFSSRVIHGVATAFLEDVWSRNFLNMFATPLLLSEYLTGLVVTSILTSLLGLLAMLVMATTLFGFSFFIYGLSLIPFLLVLFLFGVAIGIAGSAIVLRLGPASEWFVWPIPAMLSPFVGVFYPVATLPVWMQYLARILPPSYVFEGMRRIVLAGGGAGSAPGIGLLYGTGLSLVYIVLASWFFARVHRHAVRTGLIARYSAETAG